ncbi:Hydrogenase maturation protease family protein [Magnetospirillum sp. LM-5]|uniref:hydrogenase maturation protease n=1 Tax=Magnetospirillum sp. LM-5 TaxID=2681466 RepID=UPI00138179C8|nr:hydrogenase maturation protease [Magnetospirillum sp. LM-5]CAA7611557.1 Hydrogenase maturation protease family protein [Magnetospirillum sp. LM-5]
MTAILVIGIGHAFRTDDGIGPKLAELVAGRHIADVTAISHHGEGTALLELWSDAGRVILIDATISGAAPGTIRQWDASTPLPAGQFPTGSHLFGVAEGIELARRLGRLPPSLTIIGIEAADLSRGEGLSPAVEAALPQALQTVLDLIAG